MPAPALSHATEGMVMVVAAHPGETFYAAAIWLLYVDYTVFGVPCLSMNTESHLVANGGSCEDGLRWGPPDWQFDVLDPVAEAIRPFYDDLSRSLAGSEEATWDAAISLHHEILARICRRLTAQAHARAGDFASITLPLDLVVGIFGDRETEEVYDYLLRASIEPSLLARLNVA